MAGSSLIGKPPFPRFQRARHAAYGLIGAWSPYEGTGTTVHDLSGSGYDGALTSSAMWVAGPLGWAIQGNGTSQRMTVANPPTTAAPYSFTIWVYPITASATLRNIFFDNTAGVAKAGLIYNFPSSGKVQTQAAGVASTITLPLLQACHLGVVWGTATTFLYINGVLNASGANGGPPALGATFGIGGDAQNGRWFDGSWDDARLYNYALTAGTIQRIYLGQE